MAATAAATDLAVEELVRRYKWRNSMSEAVEEIRSDVDRFAGVYFSDESGVWQMYVQQVGGAPESSALRALLPLNAPVAWGRVTRSYRDLLDIQAELSPLLASGSIVRALMIDVPRNRVEVVASERNVDLEASLAEAYGDAVYVAVSRDPGPVACNSNTDPSGGSRYECTPWRGGIEIQADPGSHDNRCTWTMWAKNKNNGTLKYATTAGHCGPNYTSDLWHDEALIGDGVNGDNSLNKANPRSDSRRILTAGNLTQMNRIYETNGTKSYAVTSTKTWIQQNSGDWVCKHGVGGGTWFGRACGQIIGEGLFNVDGHNIPVKRADFNGTCWFTCDGHGLAGGDSGAPVVYAGAIFGLAIHGDGWYSTANDVEFDLNVWFCLSTSCAAP